MGRQVQSSIGWFPGKHLVENGWASRVSVHAYCHGNNLGSRIPNLTLYLNLNPSGKQS